MINRINPLYNSNSLKSIPVSSLSGLSLRNPLGDNESTHLTHPTRFISICKRKKIIEVLYKVLKSCVEHKVVSSLSVVSVKRNIDLSAKRAQPGQIGIVNRIVSEKEII